LGSFGEKHLYWLFLPRRAAVLLPTGHIRILRANFKGSFGASNWLFAEIFWHFLALPAHFPYLYARQKGGESANSAQPIPRRLFLADIRRPWRENHVRLLVMLTSYMTSQEEFPR
jgi:hypothetical protein